VASRRKSPRVEGPFDAHRVGESTVHLRVKDLSVGGCLIESLHKEKVGHRFTFEIELPEHGWVSLQAETLYVRDDHEVAVRFVDLSDDTRRILHSVVRRLLAKRSQKDTKKPAKA
jgi:PilZ domain-containing protein